MVVLLCNLEDILMFLNIDKQVKENIAFEDDNNNNVTYGELCEICKDFMGKNLTRCVVFILCENTSGAMTSLCVCESSNLIPLVISAAIDQELLNNLIQIYRPSYIFAPKNTDKSFEKEIIWEKLDYMACKTQLSPYPINAKLSLLMTTSGSTGSPKLVRYKYGNLESNAKNASVAFRLKKDDRALCDLPIHYTMGLNVITSHLVIGATVVLTQSSLLSDTFWNIMNNNNITNFCGVPFSYEVFSKLRFTEMELPNLKTICEGGGKLTDKRFEELAQYAKNKNKSFFASFGTTETSARMSVLPPELALNKIGSIGKAIPEGKLYLLNSDGSKIEKIEAEGELGYSGPNVTMGYALCKEDLLKGDEWNGEYRTGDIAYRDADGCYFIIGRTSRFLKLYGLRISLDRVELLIRNQFDIECACDGTDDRMEIYITEKKFQGKVIPYISKKINLQPTVFHLNVIDEIPKSENGKIKYSVLKTMC